MSSNKQIAETMNSIAAEIAEKEHAASPSTVEVVTDEGPLFSDEELEAIAVIANGGTIDGLDVVKLDATILSGIAAGAGAAEKGLRDMAGFMGAALKLRTWTRVTDPATMTLFASEAAFVEWTLSKTPLLATVARRELLGVIDGITDENGKPLGVRKMAELLGVGKSVVAEDLAAARGDAENGGERGPQTGGEVVSNPTAVRRHVTGFASAGTRVRDDAAEMTDEQLLQVVAEARDTLGVALAIAQSRGVELPAWAVTLIKAGGITVTEPKPKLRSGAEGTVATGPVLAGAPADPTTVSAPAPAAKPKPKPRAAAAS